MHRVQYASVPELSSFGKHGGFYARQLERLGAVSRSQVRNGAPEIAGFADMLAALAHYPVQDRVSA